LRTGAFFAATFFAGAFFAGAFFAGADFFTAVFGAGAFVLNIASARASSKCGDARDRASDRARIGSLDRAFCALERPRASHSGSVYHRVFRAFICFLYRCITGFNAYTRVG